jgi:putative thioredoxin
MGDLDTAEALLNNAAAAIAAAPEIEAARAQIALARQADEAGPLAELQSAVAANPDDLQARFDYAKALYAAGQAEAAIEELLDLFRRDREWNDGAAKAQLFTIFDALKPTDPLVQKGRRRLSSMIFA